MGGFILVLRSDWVCWVYDLKCPGSSSVYWMTSNVMMARTVLWYPYKINIDINISNQTLIIKVLEYNLPKAWHIIPGSVLCVKKPLLSSHIPLLLHSLYQQGEFIASLLNLLYFINPWGGYMHKQWIQVFF